MKLFKKNIYLIKESPYKMPEGKIGREIVKEYDEEKDMPYETGKYLEALFSNSDEYIIGINQIGFSDLHDEIITRIFNEGIINFGDMMQGIISNSNRDIEKIVTLVNSFTLLIGLIKNANRYKNSKGVFVIKIPKSYLGLKEGDIKPIYFNDNGTMHLLPEFICGYIPVGEDAVGDFIPNPNYSDFHNYKDDGLEYDTSVLYKIKEKEGNVACF